MQIIIHRGTHQIGGAATEIRTAATRILIDLGDELSINENFTSAPLSIPGVTDTNGSCAAALFTHNHMDHIGQLKNIRDGIPLYMGPFAKAVLLAALPKSDTALKSRVEQAMIFTQGERFPIGDMFITPFSVDHSACDSYMFLVEAGGKKILHTGDFRLHGFRGKAMPKILNKLIGNVDALIIEGTAFSRTDAKLMTERELQQKARAYMEQYNYVFVLCASTNLERICALSKAVPQGKYFICDEYQNRLLDLIQQYWGNYSPLYRNIKKIIYGENLLSRFHKNGFLMMVRDNRNFREIIRSFPAKQSIILYSMWNGYLTRPGSTIPDFLNLAEQWEPLHTSGHASQKDIQTVIEKVNPNMIIPIHTDMPDMLKMLCPNRHIVILNDRDQIDV
ncbi:MBL fold hydrolase [Clostridium sp. chh4-2]|uniref:MBL fold metallo-hydrolase n=1 Tax=Clostridium sp. chh4-2 TaxID=2067550 RepID=UPI000CCE1BED|nr:MBL fold metallo-hydrolase [Clostridium sp. chh4-2]PNV59399.1 MBL fold hydrolase [Clostridium sp. chh4-2]